MSQRRKSCNAPEPSSREGASSSGSIHRYTESGKPGLISEEPDRSHPLSWPTDPRNSPREVKQVFFKYESRVIYLSLKPNQISRFVKDDGIYYFHGRISKEKPFKFKDLNIIPFLDAPKMSGPTLVLLVDSPILYALVVDIHCNMQN